MTTICRNGHLASDPEFCDVCGTLIAPPETRRTGRVRPPGGWFVTVVADRHYFDRAAPDDAAFPAEYESRTVALVGDEVLIGRRSRSRQVAPELDLSGPEEDYGVSHRHAWLKRQADGVLAISDAGSANGTRINDSMEPIAPHESVVLQPGDEIHIGFWTTLIIEDMPDGAPARTAAPGSPIMIQAGGDVATQVAWLVSASIAGVARLRQRSAARYERTVERFQDVVASVCSALDLSTIGATDDSAVIAAGSADLSIRAAFALLAGWQNSAAGPATTRPTPEPTTPRIAIDARVFEPWSAALGGADRESILSLSRSAHAGQVLVSESAVSAGFSDLMPDDAGLRNLGSHRLQNLAQPRRVYQLMHPLLASDFPELRDLDQVPNNLPEQPTDFIGRESDLRRVLELLGNSRLCTIVGPGGVGKTRLAVQAGARVLATVPGGVWLADLSATRDPALVASAVMNALGVREGGAGTVAAPGRAEVRSAAGRLVEHLADASAVLILDNCEHILDGCRNLATMLLRSCSALRIVVTSRERLNVVGETVLRLEPLRLPRAWEAAADLREADAVALFLNRVELHNPGLAVSDDDLDLVVQICRRIDGIPLAIEIAAARTAELDLAQLAELLDRNQMGARPTSTTGTDIQRTLQATIEWSHRLLSPREKLLFRRLAAFAGGFDLQACRSVCAGSGVERFEVADLLNSLVSRSLVEAEASSTGTRYRLLEIARRYAAERLADTDDVGEVTANHLAFFRRQAENAESELSGPHHTQWFATLDAEHGNLLLAMTYGRQAGSGDDERIAAALGHYWLIRGRLIDGCALLDEALASNPDRTDALRAKTLTERAMLACFAGDFDATATFAERGYALAELTATTAVEARSLTLLGLVAAARNNLADAVGFQHRALERCAKVSDPALEAFITTNLANVLNLAGDVVQARRLYDEAMRLRRLTGDEWGIAWSLFRSGSLATWEGRFPEAVAELSESLQHAQGIEFGQGILLALLGRAEAYFVNGDHQASEAGYLEALDVARDLEESTGACLALAGLGNVAIARGDLAAAANWLTEEEAVSADRTAATLAAVKECRASLASARGDEQTAEALHREALGLRQETWNLRGMVDQLERLALVASRLGNLTRAALLLASASKRRDELGLPVPHMRKGSIDQLVIRVADSVDDGVHSAWADGLDMSFEDVLGLALADARTVRSTREAPPVLVSDARNLPLRFEGWSNDVAASLMTGLGASAGERVQAEYGQFLPTEYWITHPPERAAQDLALLDAAGHGLAVRLGRLPLEGDGFRSLTLAQKEPIALADVIPVLENFGLRVLDERPYLIGAADGRERWLYDLRLTRPQIAADHDGPRTDQLFEEAFSRVSAGGLEDDGFNRLVLGAGLSADEVVILRAYGRYQRLSANAFSLEHIQRTLADYPDLAAAFVALFRARFDPRGTRPEDADEIDSKLVSGIDAVGGLDEDRILRGIHALVHATVRTNYFQADGLRDGVLSLKLDPHRIPFLPRPRPMFEVFVYSPFVEGVHLRGGRISRGGIRWSDRLEDFRTEILGLMKAQMVKNTVIVATGAKGGFVVRRPSPDRAALQSEGRACYRAFLGGLLDVTDNIVDGLPRPPQDVLRHDEDDPYLVVAADKGTATFADLGNEVSGQRGFWLGDAFASGGSAGYDHKRLGITARGAWESARRHFATLGKDPSRDPVTVVGVGDMSGDVFGNGLLRSESVRLIAAFDHRHIFIDPDPDPGKAFAERSRIYALAESSWADYDAEILSAGGAVYSRQAKSIVLSSQACRALGVASDTFTPEQLVTAVLCAPVDLLYNGGVGTYVRSSTESNADVGDKGNDASRASALNLRCRVVVEGGNLGVTQRGRVEFARGGGLINTDAIDNSAGVDCSDHEVNIKILLNQVMAAGALGKAERDELLMAMSDDVAALVLRDNFAQAFALACTAPRAAALAHMHLRYMRSLEQQGVLVRDLEGLPDDAAFTERLSADTGLTSPELAVLLAYTKIALYEELLTSAVPDDPAFEHFLFSYFPPAIRERFCEDITAHPLRREIIATALTNEVVNRLEVSFLFRLEDSADVAAPRVVAAYDVAVRLLHAREAWQAVDAVSIGKHTPAVAATELIERAIEGLVRWLVRNIAPQPWAPTGDASGMAALMEQMFEQAEQILTPEESDRYGRDVASLAEVGVDLAIARAVALCVRMPDLLGVAGTINRSGRDVDEVVVIYREVGVGLRLDWLRSQVDTLADRTLMESLTRQSLRESIESVQLAALDAALASDTTAGPEAIEPWLDGLGAAMRHARHMAAEVHESGSVNAGALGLVLNEYRTAFLTARG